MLSLEEGRPLSKLNLADALALWDKRRTLGMTTFGLFYYGFPCKLLYMSYERVLGPGVPIVKAVFDSCVHTPFVLIPSFYFVTCTVKGQESHGPKGWIQQLEREWYVASTASAAFWVPAQIICFRFLPLTCRVQYICTLSLFQKAGLSWYSNRTRVEQAKLDAKRNSPAVHAHGHHDVTQVSMLAIDGGAKAIV